MKCRHISRPMNSAPSMSGVKKPQTGHKLRTKKIPHSNPTAVMVGMTRGQYTIHALGSFNPLIRGRYTARYSVRTEFTPKRVRAELNSGRMTLSSEVKTAGILAKLVTAAAVAIHATLYDSGGAK